MTDSTPQSESPATLGASSHEASPPGAPRWVKVAAIAAITFVVLLAIMLLTGGPGSHGPGRHTGSGDAGEESRPPPSGERHRPPAGVPSHDGEER